MADGTNLIDAQLSAPAPAALPAGPAAPVNLIDQQFSQSAAPAPTAQNLIDSALRPAAFVPAPLGSQATGLSATKPSLWQRITSVFTEGIPSLSSRTVYDPKSGEMQLITPEAAMTPQEQTKHPIATGVGEVAGGITSPESVATIAATGGLGEIGGVAGKIIPRLVSGGFSAQMIYQAASQLPDVKKALQNGDYSTVERLLTKIALQGGLAALGIKHAVTGKGAVSGKAKPSEMELSETRAVEETSPTAQVVKAPAPEVRVADNAAAKTHTDSQDVVHRGLPPADKGFTRVRDSQNGLSDVPTHRIEEAKTVDPGLKIVSGEPTARIVSEDYIPTVSKDEVLAEAIQRMVNNSAELNQAGLDPSKIETKQDVATMLDQTSAHIQRNLDPRVGATIGFEAQKGLARDLNMTVEDLLSRKSGTAFSAEQAIAARALLKASQTDVMNLARIAATGDDAYQAEFTKALAQHQEIMNQARGIAAEAGRALGSFNIREEELPEAKISNALAELPPESQLKAAQLLSKLDPTDTRQVNSFIEQIKPSSGADKIFEYYRNALLSSPKTVIVKGASELGMMALEATKKVVAGGLSKVGITDADRFASESYWYAKGAVQALRHAGAVLKGEFDLKDAPGFEETHQQAIKGGLGTVVRIPSTAIGRQTNLMYLLNYEGELNAQAARVAIKEGFSGGELSGRQEYLVRNPTEEMTDAAHKLAMKNTFQSELGKLGQRAQALAQYGPMKFLFPFFKTPINLVKASAEYSPYGLLKGLVTGDVDTGTRGLVGSSIAAGIAYLAAQGHITGGGPLEYKKRQTLQATGWQPYSVKIAGKYYSYHRFEPLGLAMGLVADTIHAMQSGASDEEVQSRADASVQHIARNLDDLPFFIQLSDLVGNLHGDAETKVQRFIARQAGGFVPALVSNIAQMSDTTVRRPTTAAEQVQSRIPGMTQNVPPALDITGRPVQNPESKLGGLNPFPVSTAKGDPVLNELARLGVPTPPLPTKVSIGEGKFKKIITLSKAQAERIAADEGAQLRKQVTAMMSQPQWQRTDDNQKREQIKKVHEFIDKGRLMKLRQMGIIPVSTPLPPLQ